MGHVLWEMFGWPAGIVVGNLIASALWAAPALWHLHAKLDAQHAERMAAHARAAEVAQKTHDAHLETIRVLTGRLGGWP